jgi:hypothetical protein
VPRTVLDAILSNELFLTLSQQIGGGAAPALKDLVDGGDPQDDTNPAADKPQIRRTRWHGVFGAAAVAF